MLVGGGGAAGGPELSSRLSFPAEPTLRATPRQLALLAALQADNLASGLGLGLGLGLYG